MTTVKAHYDGEHIQLDKPFDLPPDAPLLVTVPVAETDKDREAWIAVVRQTLERAYGEAEPEYTGADIKAMKELYVVLALLPQATGAVKNRPAIVLRAMPPFGDFLVGGVSTYSGLGLVRWMSA